MQEQTSNTLFLHQQGYKRQDIKKPRKISSSDTITDPISSTEHITPSATLAVANGNDFKTVCNCKSLILSKILPLLPVCMHKNIADRLTKQSAGTQLAYVVPVQLAWHKWHCRSRRERNGCTCYSGWGFNSRPQSTATPESVFWLGRSVMTASSFREPALARQCRLEIKHSLVWFR